MSDKKYSNLHPEQIIKLKKALEYGSKINPLEDKELRKEILEKAKLKAIKKKSNFDSKYYKKKKSNNPDSKYYK